MSDITLDLSQLITAEDKAAQKAQEAAEAARTEALAYLAETDWYVTRLSETGEAIPAEISAARTAARGAL